MGLYTRRGKGAFKKRSLYNNRAIARALIGREGRECNLFPLSCNRQLFSKPLVLRLEVSLGFMLSYKKLLSITYRVSRNFCGLEIFLFRGNLFLRLGQTGFSYWELIFAIFRKYPVPSIDNISDFVKYVQ